MKVTSCLLNILFFVVLGFLFRDELHSLFFSWVRDSNYQHGFFVLAISIFLVFYQLKKYPQKLLLWKQALETPWVKSEDWKRDAILWVIVLFLYALGMFKGITYLNLMTLLLFVRLWSFSVIGKEGSSILNFPLFYVFLAFPLPGLASLTIYLQRYTAHYVSQFMMKYDEYIGHGYYKMWDEGNFLHLPNFSFEIVPECTGVHSFLTLLSLMVLFLGFLNLKKYQKVMVGLFCVPISLVGNFLRILTLVFIAFKSSQETAMAFWHYWGGLFFFAISLSLEFLVITFFQLSNRRCSNNK